MVPSSESSLHLPLKQHRTTDRSMLLSLPPELRLLIYEALLERDRRGRDDAVRPIVILFYGMNPIKSKPSTERHQHVGLRAGWNIYRVLEVCRQVHDELKPLLKLSDVELYFKEIDRFGLHDWLGRVNEPTLRQIGCVRMQVWGPCFRNPGGGVEWSDDECRTGGNCEGRPSWALCSQCGYEEEDMNGWCKRSIAIDLRRYRNLTTQAPARPASVSSQDTNAGDDSGSDEDAEGHGRIETEEGSDLEAYKGALEGTVVEELLQHDCIAATFSGFGCATGCCADPPELLMAVNSIGEGSEGYYFTRVALNMIARSLNPLAG